jgi:hypothetical protein
MEPINPQFDGQSEPVDHRALLEAAENAHESAREAWDVADRAHTINRHNNIRNKRYDRNYQIDHDSLEKTEAAVNKASWRINETHEALRDQFRKTPTSAIVDKILNHKSFHNYGYAVSVASRRDFTMQHRQQLILDGDPNISHVAAHHDIDHPELRAMHALMHSDCPQCKASPIEYEISRDLHRLI